MAVRKLIEVALPLDAINEASAREKSIRHGHPSTLHLWWARRPLATARAVIWASLVDDPSSHLELFPTEQEQERERERLFDILERLVVWENSNDPEVLEEAKEEIRRCVGDDPLSLLDPFAGGGAIPLEAQRLGLKAYAQDLNPVAVTINKAMIEIPPKFAGRPAVNPGSRASRLEGTWEGNSGLAADVEYYGNWMKEEARKRIGNLYPSVPLSEESGDSEGAPIAWIWARTVTCPNPACAHETILARSFDLSKKKGKEWHIRPITRDGEIEFEVHEGKSSIDGTVNRRGATCIHCGQPVKFDYIREESKANRMGSKLMAIVAEGPRGRIYLNPTLSQIRASEVDKPESFPTGDLAKHFTGGSCVPYGLDTFDKLFTNRQLNALTTLSDLVKDAQNQAYSDAVEAGMDSGISLSDGGVGAEAYGQAIGVYLAFVVDKMTDYHSSICSWHSSGEKIRNTFGRQAIPMVWDYAEANPFCSSSGSFDNMLSWVVKCVSGLPQANTAGLVRQHDAQSDNGMRGIVVSTDPPYYDNIAYADLSDFFYVWLRRSLRETYPSLFGTMLVPKLEELVATPYRENRGKQGARDFFEQGMFETFKQVYSYARDDIPVTIYYAFKQSETESSNEVEATASTGWETMLSAIIKAGFSITGTWPVRTEMSNRSIASGANALASSIVLVCRKRPEDAPIGTRRDFAASLRRDLDPALDKLSACNIAPVDMAQSAIGPGIAAYSRFSRVLESDGSEMTVRSALQAINQAIDEHYSSQEGALDRESRLCLDLWTQYAFNDIPFGDADTLARAKNASIQGIAQRGAVFAAKGVVRIRERSELPERIDFASGCTWLITQQLVRDLESGGVDACARDLKDPLGMVADDVKSLAYRLYTISERKGWSQEAYAYNSLVVAWPEIQQRAAQLQTEEPLQLGFDQYL